MKRRKLTAEGMLEALTIIKKKRVDLGWLLYAWKAFNHSDASLTVYNSSKKDEHRLTLNEYHKLDQTFYSILLKRNKI